MQKRMNWQATSFDWNQARAFLVTAEEGSFSAAAKTLRLTQPTLGRQVAALEKDLGVTLFERGGRSLVLTQSGLELLDHVRGMGSAANSMSLAASGQSQTIKGQVCITATEVMSIYILPPILKRLREIAPEIEVDLVASDTVRDLMQREADIAIRHVRPEQPDLIMKLVSETNAHFYASTAYLEEHGRPKIAGDLTDIEFISPDHSDRMIPRLNAMGLPLTRENFKLISTSGNVYWEMVKQGLGIGLMMENIADLTPGVERILLDVAPIPVPTWLTAHRELHTSRRIRLVYDLLAEFLSRKN